MKKKKNNSEQAHVPRYAFQNAKPCGAKTRKGTLCKAPATPKGRCRFHGGAKGSGTPKGNRNALKHGAYSQVSLALQRQMRAILRDGRDFLKGF